MLKEINNNSYKDNEGNERHVYALNAPDLEQLNSNEILLKITELKEGLNKSSKINKSYKIYSIGSEIILDTPVKNQELSYYQLSKEKDHLNKIIKYDNFHSNVIFKDDYCKVNGQYIRFVSIEPQYQEHHIDINGLSQYTDYFVTFKKVNTKKAKMQVGAIRTMSHSSLYKELSDIEGIEIYKENEEMLKKIMLREEELFKVEIHFILKSNTEEELVKLTDIVIEALENDGLNPQIITDSINRVFSNYIVGIEPKLNREMLFHSSLLVNCLPSHSDKLHSQSSNHSGLELHARSFNPVIFNPMDGHSYSMCITGLTGHGKTFFTNKLITNELESKRKVFILEPKRDYEKLALLENAHFITESINPMTFNDPVYLRNIIISKIPNGERSAKFEGKLLKAIKELELYNYKNFFKVLETLEANGFNEISCYFEEIADKITEKKEKIKDFTYVDFNSFTAQTLPMLLAFSFEYVKRLNAPYNLIVDEAHRVFSANPQYLSERVREMRVQRSSLTTITQNYSDLLSTQFGQAVADNSFHKIFFHQTVKEDLGLDSFDCEQIMSLKTQLGSHSEFYYKSEINRKVVRYYPTLKELELFCSDNLKREKLLNFVEKFKDYNSVEQLVDIYIGGQYAGLY